MSFWKGMSNLGKSLHEKDDSQGLINFFLFINTVLFMKLS